MSPKYRKRGSKLVEVEVEVSTALTYLQIVRVKWVTYSIEWWMMKLWNIDLRKLCNRNQRAKEAILG